MAKRLARSERPTAAMIGSTNRRQASVAPLPLSSPPTPPADPLSSPHRSVAVTAPVPSVGVRPHSAPARAKRRLAPPLSGSDREDLCADPYVGSPHLIQGDIPPEIRVAQLKKHEEPRTSHTVGFPTPPYARPSSAMLRAREKPIVWEKRSLSQQPMDALLRVLRSRAQVRSSITPFFRAMNTTRAGGVGYGEFVAMMRHMGLRESDEVLLQFARSLDKSNAGKVGYRDLALAINPDVLEDGLLKQYLSYCEGKAPRPERPPSLSLPIGTKPMPSPRASLRADFPGSRNRPVSQWGGVHLEDMATAEPPAQADPEMEGSISGVLGKLEGEGGGVVTKKDLAATFEKMNLKPSELCIQRIFEEFDTAGEGQIHYRDFATKIYDKLEQLQADAEAEQSRSAKGERPHGWARETAASEARRVGGAATAASEARRVGGAALSGKAKVGVVCALEDLRARLQHSHSDVRAALKHLKDDSVRSHLPPGSTPHLSLPPCHPSLPRRGHAPLWAC
ncbi:MAG: hypothetical protein SGPRY_003459 [Prymnesium sp.]